MANKPELMAVKDRGWLNGFGPLWRKENHALWGTWSWLVNILVWMAIIDGLMAVVSFAPAETDTAQAQEPAGMDALTTHFLIAALVPAAAVIIFGHEDLIDERKLGTAAWVLSKPVSRAAFLLSKLSAKALGALGTMVVVQGLIAYLIYKAGTGTWLSIPGFLAATGLVALFVTFFLALTLMLGALFPDRRPVIGISLVLLCISYPTIFVPWLGKALPASLFLSAEPGQPGLATALVQGLPLPTLAPVLGTGLLVILFIIVALLRFEREEF